MHLSWKGWNVMAEKFNFEESLTRLDEISMELGSGNVELDRALELYTEASKLIQGCNKKLASTQTKFDKLMANNGAYDDE